MEKKIKKIMMTTFVSVASLTAIGCGTTNSTLAKKINKGMDEFVSSINNLDYVDTSTKDESTIGKIVSASAYSEQKYISPYTTSTTVENTITRPSERSDNFKLYVLSDTPFVTLTSDDNTTKLNLSMQFSTEKIENTSDEINEKINELILKRSILMIYANEIHNGNVNLSDENRTAINAYVNVIKENASFLKGNKGIVKNQLNLASDLLNTNSSDNLVNYYIIKSGEALEIRSNKIDSTISAIDSIIDIVEQNLSPSSAYYQSNLSNTYDNLINDNTQNTSQDNSENSVLARSIKESLSMTNQAQKSQVNATQNNINANTNNNTNINTKSNNQITTLENNIDSRNINTNNASTNTTIQNTTNTNDRTTNNTTNSTNIHTKDIKRDYINNRINRTNRRRNINQNNTNTQNQNDSNQNVNNSTNRTIRANRTPERINQNITTTQNDNVVSRVPYKTNV